VAAKGKAAATAAAATAAEPAGRDEAVDGPEDFGDVETSSDEDDDDDDFDDDEEEAIGGPTRNKGEKKKKKKRSDGSDYKGDTLLSQFDKVTRTKNRWKCVLRSGVLRLGGREVLFQTAAGDMTF